MIYTKNDNRLVVRDNNKLLWIEPWGENSFRVRITAENKMDQNDWALEDKPTQCSASIDVHEETFSEPWHDHYPNKEKHIEKATVASITNGKITAKFNREGWLSFQNNKGEILLEEYWRNRRRIDRHCVPTNHDAREFKPILGTTDYKVTLRFEAYDNEKIFGMGQYQDSHLDKKGSVLELAQKNSQSSVPFLISNRGYGFLWNNPSIGNATFAMNKTEWSAESTKKIDYWITAGDTPSQIEKQYTDVTGHVPIMPDYAMGFWQCKLRYKNQEEVLNIAREYKKRNLPLSVIVIDFFHWSCQGDYQFDPIDFPDPEAMVHELKQMGIKVMVSVWPTIDERSCNYAEMEEKGLLIGFDRGVGVNMTWMGNTKFFDATNPEAQKYVFNKCYQNYYKKGIELFWLDEAEPEFGIYDYDYYRYSIGPALQVSNIYPKLYAKAFYDGFMEHDKKDFVNLVRCAWAGSQKYGTLVWSGDIHSSFRAFKENLQAGLNMGLAGIPWWTTDIGGFLGGDIHDAHFQELLVRWFQWAVFCPVMRLHGERPPFKALDVPYHGQIKQMESAQDNEIWSFGYDVYVILESLLLLREKLKPYIKTLMTEASENGSPIMRTMFYEFPQDEKCWELQDQYMFGSKLLVAPVLSEGAKTREIYLPKLENEKWIDTLTKKEYSGDQTITVDTPLNYIPVFSKGSFEISIY